jgi:nitrogen regulatory protein PII
MNTLDQGSIFELIYVIVPYGKGSNVLQKAKKLGIPGGTVILGRGTVCSLVLNFLSICDERKEVVLLGTDENTAKIVIDSLNREFSFDKPNHGIIFAIRTCNILGSRCYKCENLPKEKAQGETMHKLLITIVNKGRAEDVINIAKQAGSKGGTILNARGSGTLETTKVFNMDIEPEKEIVMIIATEDQAQTIACSIRDELELNKPGHGIIFIQDVYEAHGIAE